MKLGIMKGANKLAAAVQLTLGPGGRTVVIDPFEQANFNDLSVKPQP
jgi:chaperonin GroEL (HSP60 family)